MNSFTYLRPTTVREACLLKALHGDRARFWAGGTDLGVRWRAGEMEFDHCIDLAFVPELAGIIETDEGMAVGALTTVADLEESQLVRAIAPALAHAASQVGTPQVRNIATLGGNLCNAAPSADLAVALLALDAQAVLVSVRGQRVVALEDFFLGVNETVAATDELLAEVRIPCSLPRTASAFVKLGRLYVDIAVVNVAVSATVDREGLCTRARIVLGAVAPVPMRARKAERTLVSQRLPGVNVAEVADTAARETSPITDVRSSAEYRTHVSKVLVRRALDQVVRDLGEGAIS